MRKQLPHALVCLLIGWLTLVSVGAQDAREALGPKDKPARAGEAHPLTRLMSQRQATLRPELRGQHPRVYVTEPELQQLRARARTTHRAVWQRALQRVRALQKEPPPAPAQARRAQNEVGIGIAEAALAYRIEGDKKYLDAAKQYLEAAVSYDVWGYTYSKPNVDLAAGHLLYGMGWGYDLLYHDLTEAERARHRAKLTKHARLLVKHYRPKPGRNYSYSQNHVFIPMAGLGVAAYALGYAGVPLAAHHNTLLVDRRGQAKEGKGHDAFADFPYELLDQLRISEVKVGAQQVYLRGEAATTYAPERGLTRFTRHFLFQPGVGFEIKDELAAQQPRTFTTLLHADEKIAAAGKDQFIINTPTAKLAVTVVEPQDFKAVIEPNILTAPGQPGSVDKGAQQQRGERLAVSNARPATSAQLALKLKISKGDSTP